MKKIKYTLFIFLFLVNFFKSQVGDSGYPFLYQKLLVRSYIANDLYKNSIGDTMPFQYLIDNIPSFETEGLNNQRIIDEVSQLNDPIYLNQNIYGQSVYKEINMADTSQRIEHNERYYNLYKIKSSDAKALQIYFKKYHLPKGSTLYFYSENGFILGEFNDSNNPELGTKGLEFGTQPIPGNNFYVELSYPIFSTEIPELIAEKIIHSTTDFYGGAYGQAGNCHKNIACEFTGTNDKSRNMKSVGLMLYPLYINGIKQSTYSATCSGNLMNNTRQDGFPYFLTAAHCIGPAAANNNMNWSAELITLFNYESKACTSDGSDAPSSLSNNSVLGCTILTQSPQQAGDYALLMLKTTATKLTEYKVCFAGWDNNPNAYSINATNAYGVHHPKGDTKKISFLDTVYPVSGNMGPVYPQNPQGSFLQTSWRSGIVEKGSSGSPLFNSFDRLVGSLSTGPDPSIFNCNIPDLYSGFYYTYYSRFSYNYYTMSAWLNPIGSNVQSIGPYCSNTSIQVGAPITVVFPGGGGTPTNPGAIEDIPIDVNGKPTHPSNTFGKKFYLKEKVGFDIANESAPNTNFEYYNTSLKISDDIFAASTNIYATRSQQVVNKFELWGIYKIIDCNKLKYIKPAPILVRNPVTLPGDINEVAVNVVSVTNDKVHILIYCSKWVGNNMYRSYELQTYRVVNNELVYVTYYPIATNIQSTRSYGYNQNIKNRVLISRKEGTQTIFDSYFFNETINTWTTSSNVLSFPKSFDIKVLDEKIFVLASSGNGYDFDNKITIYAFAPQSPNLGLQTTLSNIFLGNPSSLGILAISKKTNDEYWLVYDKYTSGGTNFQLMSVNLSYNSVSHFPVSDDFKYVGTAYNTNFIIRNNEIVKIVKNASNPPTGSEYSTHMYMSFTNPNGIWEQNKINFVKWRDITGYNDKYLLTIDMLNGSYIGGFSFRDWTLSIRELDYINHPYTRYDNVTYYTAAYHRPKKLEHDLFDQGIQNGKRVFKNIILSNTNYFPFKFEGGIGSPYDTRTYEVRTVILDNKTAPVTGNKNVYVYAKYSVDMKPGFSVSSSTGVEFHAIAQELLPVDIPACSFTFDDMLNPKITETPNETLYLKQASGKSGNKPYYGEIVLNDGNTNKEVVIDRGITLYPNPTKDILTIDFNGNKFKTLEVYSIDGRKVITKEVSSMNIVEVNLLQYPAGIYMVTLIDSNGKTYPNKVIKK